jgi:branched-chain amino acid transport system substrate-binding protein
MADHNVTRRDALAALGAAGATGLAGCLGGEGTPTETEGTMNDDEGTPTNTPVSTTAADPSGTVKVGVLQPLSGSIKYYGAHSYQGFLSGLAHKDGSKPPSEVATGQTTVGVGDVDYELYVRDSKFSADEAQSLATDLVQNEGVDLLFGCASSAAAERLVNTVVKATDTPFLPGPAASAAITSDSSICHRRVFRASENTAMDALSGGTYVAENTDIGKVYLFGADYSFGHAVVDNYRKVLERNDVEIVGEKFVERGYSEWEPLLQNAEDAGAEGIVTGFTVRTLPAIFKTFLGGDYSVRAFGGFATLVTNKIMGDIAKNTLGTPLTAEKLDEAGLGPFTTRYHWNQYDNEINNTFVSDHVDVYGSVPDLFSAGTFTAASALHQAVADGGSTNADDIVGALRGMTVMDTPKGSDGYTFQQYNNQARSAMTVAKPVPTSDEWADAWGAAAMPGEPLARIEKGRTTIPEDSSDMGCSL